MAKRKLTPKQLVLREYPGAYSKQGLMTGNWYIYRICRWRHVIGVSAMTAAHAWADAADKLGISGSKS